ncbi:unnamed protein product, partial [Nesidiocoris tenuis]
METKERISKSVWPKVVLHIAQGVELWFSPCLQELPWPLMKLSGLYSHVIVERQHILHNHKLALMRRRNPQASILRT